MKIRKLLRYSLLSTAAIAAVGGASASAQTPTTGASSSVSLDEVIVTAQRRGQNMQDVPIPVNVLSAEQLESMGGASSADLGIVPGVVFTPSVAGGGLSIRGISGTNGGTDEPGNAIYVDGVYQYAASSTLLEFNGIERIEILKGPQGTLFGRNTAGGVLQVITRDPAREAVFEGELGYANYDTSSAKIYASVPLTDSLAVNLAAFGVDQKEGWGRNVVTGRDAHLGSNWGVRGKLKWQAPSGKTDVVLSALYGHEEPVASSAGAVAPGARNPLGQPSPGILNTASELSENRTVQQTSFSATVHHDLGFARLTSITADSRARANVLTDGDASALDLVHGDLQSTYNMFTQEVQLQSQPDSKLNWIVGAFYMNATTEGLFNFEGAIFPPGGVHIISTLDTISYAGFGQATYPITDNTNVTAGIRYTTDERTLTFFGSETTKTDSSPSWRFAVDHKLLPDVLAYVSYSRGFKSGVFNATSPDKPPADPTTLDAYEVGLKSEIFDNRLRVNASAFYYDYRDIQIELFDERTQTAYFANAGAAHSYGVDIDAAFALITNLTLTGSVSLLKAEFTSSTAAPCYTLGIPGGLNRLSCPLDGKALPFSPEVVVTLGADYKRETSVGTFNASGTYSHNSGFFVDPSNFRLTRAKAYDLINASLGWTSPSERLNVSVWGKNLLDERRITGALLGAGLTGTSSFPMPPLTFGATIGFKY